MKQRWLSKLISILFGTSVIVGAIYGIGYLAYRDTHSTEIVDPVYPKSPDWIIVGRIVNYGEICVYKARDWQKESGQLFGYYPEIGLPCGLYCVGDTIKTK